MATVDCSWYCKLIARPEQSLRDVTRFTQLSRDTWRAHPYHSWRARPAASASTGGLACRRLPTLLRLPLLLPPTILACLHQTANAKATAMQERNYANRAGSAGPSATAYIDRDGTIVRAIDPTKYAAWSQGDVAHPNTKIPTIAAAVASGSFQ